MFLGTSDLIGAAMAVPLAFSDRRRRGVTFGRIPVFVKANSDYVVPETELEFF
jgi:hypothetical protein